MFLYNIPQVILNDFFAAGSNTLLPFDDISNINSDLPLITPKRDRLNSDGLSYARLQIIGFPTIWRDFQLENPQFSLIGMKKNSSEIFGGF